MRGLVATGPRPQPSWVHWEGSRLSSRDNSDWDCLVFHIRDVLKGESAGLGKACPTGCFKHTACVRINYEMPFGNSAASRSLGWFPYMIYCIFIFIKGTEHSTYLTYKELVSWERGPRRAQVLQALGAGAALRWVLCYAGHGTAYPEHHSLLPWAVNICYSARIP